MSPLCLIPKEAEGKVITLWKADLCIKNLVPEGLQVSGAANTPQFQAGVQNLQGRSPHRAPVTGCGWMLHQHRRRRGGEEGTSLPLMTKTRAVLQQARKCDGPWPLHL